MVDLMNNMLALIMIGGQSKRMGGGIKSFIEFNDQSIFDRILERTKPQIKKIVINCNENNEKLKKYKLPIIKDLKNGYLGPLAGIHTGLSWLNKNEPQIEWLITLPGDTPFIPSNLISNFKKKMTSKFKIILAQSEKKTHPIIGAWHKSLISSLNNSLNNGTRKILDWAELHPLGFIKYKCNNYDPFFNINTQEDVKKAIIIEKKIFEKK